MALLLGLGVVLGMGVYLVRQQDQAAEKLTRDFAERTTLTSSLFGDTLQASEGAFEAIAAQAVAQTSDDLLAEAGLSGVGVLNADGSVAKWAPQEAQEQVAQAATDPAFRQALDAGSLTWGALRQTEAGFSVAAFVPVGSGTEQQVAVELLPVEEVARVGEGFLDTLNVLGGEAYLVDAAGRVIISSVDAPTNQPVPDPALASQIAQASSGRFEGNYFSASTVATSTWRVVLVISEDTLQEPVRSSRSVAWLLFGAFAAAVALMLAIGGFSLIGWSRLAYSRLHDTLTGLPNRSLFLENCERAMRERTPNEAVAVMFIDLDGFKPVNDTYGHLTGDKLLKAVAERLRESMRPGDSVGRFGGDEFVVLCRRVRHVDDATAIAERMLNYLREPYEIRGEVIQIGGSFGIALSNNETEDADTLIQQADAAMYEVKHSGRGRIQIYTAATEQSPHAAGSNR